MDKRRIAFIIPSLNAGGAERVVSTLSNALISNFDITIIVLYRCEAFYKLNNNIKVVFCENIYNNKRSFIKGIISHVKFIKSIKSILRLNKIEILIGFMTTTNLYAIAVSKITKTPCIISERVHPDYSPISNFVFKFRKYLYPYTNVLVVQTKEIAEYFTETVKPEKIKIINNPINPVLISKKNDNAPKENIILNVGRLDNQKNQEMLIKAFANINNENWKLVIVGDGVEKDNYLDLIKTLNLQNKVELTGNVNDVSMYYNKSKIFAFTSRFEGFPNALTEAMAFGLPCIATNCPSGPAELIEHGNNGFLIPVDDQQSLEDKLVSLMTNDKLRLKFSEECIKNMDKFKIDNVTREWQKTINNLI